MSSPYLVDAPRRVHRHWWTVVPALPEGPDTQEAHALRRVWFDHTMNTFGAAADGALRPRARGFYTEGTEDHLTPAVFQTWAALGSPASWLPRLLQLFGLAPVGRVTAARWCYAFEEHVTMRLRPIADIVLAWCDEAGEAVLVIEAKRRGAPLAAKDLTDLDRYLRMPSIAAVPRRHLGLLVDEADLPAIQARLAGAWPVTSWQALIGAQLDAARHLDGAATVAREVAHLITVHAAHHGLGRPPCQMALALAKGAGTPASYAAIAAAMEAPPAVTRFLLGSEAALALRCGRRPAAPLPWLEDAPAADEIWHRFRTAPAERQTTAERQVARWKLNWSPPTLASRVSPLGRLPGA
ncbi:hypothetical protein [Pseudoroseomonas ludipueritiae]|uniref:Uncharacterized protein n=1 Tax=Pseudoroseomonas ludipueritiae TaxID=198093 RepID=A0ABR7R2X3_9PROT|nr:hypothetical protein [Pseudoroseomonas ludipueritiae]MBC9176107.1 hypothetical protein [Pseudoroseomonas ludipueritiae]